MQGSFSRWLARTRAAGRLGWDGGLNDAEGEHDGREPQGDEEPYLADSETGLEWDDAEHGIADREGGSEEGLRMAGFAATSNNGERPSAAHRRERPGLAEGQDDQNVSRDDG